MNRSVPFRDLETILAQLGFEQKSSPDRIDFYHARSKTFFPFRPYQPKERVPEHYLVMVRKILDERGLLEAREFDRLLGTETSTNRDVAFRDLLQLLRDLGFKKEASPDGLVLYHAASDTVFPFRPLRPHERIPQHYLVMVRKIVDERGLLEAREFDRLLSKAPA